MDDATTEKQIYMSIKDLCGYFYDENLDDSIIYNRIRSQLNKNSNLFLRKKLGGICLYKLSSSGYSYLKKFKSAYDPINDKQLYSIEVF